MDVLDFLVDVIHASYVNENLARLDEMPAAETLDNLVPSSLLLPSRLLLSTVQTVNPTAVVPTIQIDRGNVARFERFCLVLCFATIKTATKSSRFAVSHQASPYP
jgi:hypothetical protein